MGLTLTPRLWLPAAIGIAIILIVFSAYVKGRADGKAYIQSRWDKAEAAALSVSIEARDEAEAAIPPLSVPDSGAAPAKPCRVQDKHDRDCG